MIQRERELEGDEFKDKDAFVTQAYKDQMAELRKAEEEERIRDGEFTIIPVSRLFGVLITSQRRKRRRRPREWAPEWPTSTASC